MLTRLDSCRRRRSETFVPPEAPSRRVSFGQPATSLGRSAIGLPGTQAGAWELPGGRGVPGGNELQVCQEALL